MLVVEFILVLLRLSLFLLRFLLVFFRLFEVVLLSVGEIARRCGSCLLFGHRRGLLDNDARRYEMIAGSGVLNGQRAAG